MDSPTLVLTTILVLPLLIEILLGLLNLSWINRPLPKTLKNLYSPKKYQKSQAYLKQTTIFQLISSTIITIITIIFLLAGGFNYLDVVTQKLAIYRYIANDFLVPFFTSQYTQALIYLICLNLLSTLVSLPFSVYKTFSLEQKFGFNQTTPQTFILDLIKSFLLSNLISSLLFLALIWFFETLQPLAWLVAWVFIVLFQLFFTFIAPALILPLFNKFTPLEKGKLQNLITQYAQSQKFRLSGIFIMDGSKRSTKTNAFFTGFGSTKRIALFDTLLKNHTPSEILTILAHEIGHYKKKHIHQMLILNSLLIGMFLFVASKLINHPFLFQAFQVDRPTIHASLIFISILISPVFTLISPLFNALSRKNEFEADAFAVQTTKKPKTFTKALKKLSSDNLTNLTPHPLKVFFDYSHPTLSQRIKNIKSL